MKIVLSPSAYYPSFGGIEEITRNLAKLYVSLGHHVAVVTNRNPHSLPTAEVHDGIQIRRFDFSYPSKTFASIKFLPKFYRTQFSLRRFLREFAPDVVHVIGAGPNSLYIANMRRQLGFCLVTTAQGERFMDATGLYQHSLFANVGLQRLLDVSNGVTACSQFVLEDLREHCALPAVPNKVVFNGVDLVERTNKDVSLIFPKRFVLGLGRLVPNKGFDVLIRAFSRIANQFADVDLVIAGDGPARQALEALTKVLNVAPRIHFLGKLDRDRVAAAFDRCELFVMCSPLEPFGIVCLEAMRAGKPVVATNAGGPAEFVSEEAGGLLVEPESIEGLADALTRLLSDSDLRSHLSDKAKEAVKQFDWPTIGRGYLDFYERICAAR